MQGCLEKLFLGTWAEEQWTLCRHETPFINDIELWFWFVCCNNRVKVSYQIIEENSEVGIISTIIFSLHNI